MITLHGSRGTGGGWRPDSDVDLALVVNAGKASPGSDIGPLLRNVLEVTLANWCGAVEADLAAIIDISDCGLKCLKWSAFQADSCKGTGVGCMGVYKIQRGFDGFAGGPAMQVKMMYPCMVIWHNQSLREQKEIS